MTVASSDFIAIVGRDTLNATVREIRDINRERIPIFAYSHIDGVKYEPKDIFFELVGVAMDTDVLQDMSSKELDFWVEFTIYESNGTGDNPDKDEQYFALDQVLVALYN